MADYYEPTAEQVLSWERWVAERPPAVRAVAARFYPWRLYRLKSTGHRVTLVSFGELANEPGRVTLKVSVDGRFNFVMFDRHVFGIDPDDMDECDLPAPGERVGCADLSIVAFEEIDAGELS